MDYFAKFIWFYPIRVKLEVYDIFIRSSQTVRLQPETTENSEVLKKFLKSIVYLNLFYENNT
jgi:uncharacterized membrane protein (DUF373 family)